MKRLIVLLLFCFLCVSASLGQITVKGKILDSATLEPLKDVTVSAFRLSDTALLNFTFTTKNGNYFMEVNSKDSILVTFSYFAYLEQHKIIGPSQLYYWRDDEIKLVADPQWTLLSKVTLKTSPITMRGDTIEINASRFKVLPGSDVAQLFKKIPGFEVDVQGSVRVNGKEIKKITVDGSEFFGNNPGMVSKTLQADMIDKVQVYEEKDELGQIKEDGEVTINLNLKKGANNGYFGDAILGAGTQELFEAGLRLNSFKGDRKLSLIANGNNNNNSGFDFGFSNWHGWVNNSRIGQDWSSNVWTNGTYNVQEQGNINNRSDYGFSYFNEIKNEIKLSGNVVYKTNYFNSENKIQSTNLVSDSTARQSITESKSSGAQESVYYKVAYSDRRDSMYWYEAVFIGNLTEGLFRENSTNEISINEKGLNRGEVIGLSAQTGDKHVVQLEFWNRFSKKHKDWSLWSQVKLSDQNEQTDLHRFNQSTNDSFNIYNDRRNKDRFYQATTRMRLPMRENWSWSITAERFAQFNTFNGIAYNSDAFKNSFEQNYSQRVDSLSNTMDNEISNNTFGTGLSYHSKKYYLGLTLNYSMANIKSKTNFLNQELNIDNNYGALLPRIYFSYGRRDLNRFSVHLYRAFNTPSGSDLLPVYNIFNIWDRSIGNPNLGQTITNNININWRRQPKQSFIKAYSLNFDYSQSDNLKVSKTFTDQNGITLSNPILLPGFQSLNNWNNVSFKVYKKVLLNYSLSLSYTERPMMFNETKVINNMTNINHSLGFSYDFSDSLGFSISYKLNDSRNKNSSSKLLNFNQITQGVSGNLRTVLPFGTSVNLELDINDQRAIPGIGKIVPLLHAYIQQPLDKSQKWNLKLSAYDIFKQNISISRNVSDGFVTISESNRLQQYFMLTLVYKVKKMGGASEKYVY